MQKAEMTQSSVSTSEGASDQLSILVADANEDFAMNVAELVRLQRIEPVVVRSAVEALRALERREFDVAVVDHRLPDGTGTDFLVGARARNGDLVTIIVTAYASLDNTVAALNEGAFALVTKDSEPERLLDAIHRATQTAALRRENRRLREIQSAILAALPDQLLLVDERLNVRNLNRRHPLLCRPDDGRPLPRPLADVISPAVVEKLGFAALVGGAKAPGATSSATISVADPASANSRIFAVDSVQLAAAPERLTQIRIVELTERLALERRLSDSEALAKLGRLTSVIAHEMRNPITGIRALCQVLQRRFAEGDPDRESVREMLSLTDRMAATIGDLLNYARPRAVDVAPVALGELAADVVRESRRWPAAEARHLDLHLANLGSCAVRGDRDRLFSALSNLVENALHAVPEGGHVVLRAMADARNATCGFVVEDDGPGVDPAIAGKLFEPFVTKKAKGTGLGLSIVKRIVESHGGRISAGKSASLGGAAFTMELPCRADSSKGDSPS